MQSTRREFFGALAVFGVSLVASRSLLACAADSSPDEASGRGDDALSSDAGTSADASAPTCNGASATAISSNHRHSLVVASQDIVAGVATGTSKTYAIKGTSSHNHDVTITAALFVELAKGHPITIVSTTDAKHSHTVTVTCASGADA